MTLISKYPDPFLEVRVQEITLPAGLTALCAGYELGKWRSEQLANHLIEWLPDFVLNHNEKAGLGSHNAVAMLARAAQLIYTSQKIDRRGEIGELLLHIAIRQVFKTVPAISKYHYKDSANDTVKGFDAVHVIVTAAGLELWLGESKFYDDISDAMGEAVQSLKEHTKRDYLRAEFIAITNKIEDEWPYAERLKKLLDRNTSLDDIFEAICIPVFLTYDSEAVAMNTAITDTYKKAFVAEVKKHHTAFCGKKLPASMRIHLFLLPLLSKKILLKQFDERLKACQTIAKL